MRMRQKVTQRQYLQNHCGCSWCFMPISGVNPSSFLIYLCHPFIVTPFQLQWRARPYTVGRQTVPSNKTSFPTKWMVQHLFSLAVWHLCWLENSCSKVFWAKFPETCYTWRASFGSSRLSSLFWVERWEHLCCCSTTAKGSCNILCVCFVVCWRW